jgi:hypothetical protein
LVIPIFLPAIRALICLFLAILAPLAESLFMKQVDGLATIRPLRDPDVHLNPGRNPLPLTLRRIWLIPSAMADTLLSLIQYLVALHLVSLIQSWHWTVWIG